VRVPPEAGAGKARVTLSFPGLESFHVTDRVVEIETEKPPSEAENTEHTSGS